LNGPLRTRKFIHRPIEGFLNTGLSSTLFLVLKGPSTKAIKKCQVVVKTKSIAYD